MVNATTFAKHLSELKKYLGYLHKLKQFPKKQVMNNWQVYGLIERYLQLAIECSLSLGEQIISNYEFRTPGYYRDIPLILAEEKVIPKKLAEAIADLAGFRNILVHGYTKIDRVLVHHHLQKDLTRLNHYIQHLAKFVKS